MEGADIIRGLLQDGTQVILAAAKIAGVGRVFRVGGAQAVAALAFGTQSVPRVDKIVGPESKGLSTHSSRCSGASVLAMSMAWRRFSQDMRYVKLNTNESPFLPAPGVLEAVSAEVERLSLYPDPEGNALRRGLARRYGVEPEPGSKQSRPPGEFRYRAPGTDWRIPGKSRS